MSATPLPLNPLGNTGLKVTSVTLGGGPLGSMPQLFGNDVAASAAIETVHAALDAGIRTIDTSNGYSSGESERRIGQALREYGTLPDDLLVITKVDPDGADYSDWRIRKSVNESMHRLGMEYLPVVMLHDPEFHDFNYITGPEGAVEGLLTMQREGKIGHIGLAGGDTRIMKRYWHLRVFEVLLVHNRWTLIDRSAGELLKMAEADGAGLINAAVLGGGALTDPVRVPRKYGYGEASREVLAAIQAMRDVCREWGIDLGTAAVRFSTRDPRFATTVVGMSKPGRVEKTVHAATIDLPEEFWTQLELLAPPERDWLDRQ